MLARLGRKCPRRLIAPLRAHSTLYHGVPVSMATATRDCGVLARQPRVGQTASRGPRFAGRLPGGVAYPTGRERPRRHYVATLSQASADLGNRGRTRAGANARALTSGILSASSG